MIETRSKLNQPNSRTAVFRPTRNLRANPLAGLLIGILLASPLSGATQAAVDVPNPSTTGLSADAVARIKKARQAVLATPTEGHPWARLGAICDAYKLYNCAAISFGQGHALLPDDFNFAYFAAITLDLAGRGGDDSIALYKAAVELNPKYAPVHWRMGLAQERLGRMSEARDAYQRATKLDPYLAIGHRSAGMALLALGDVKNSLRHLERARDLSPYDGAVYEALAQAYHKSGAAEQAREAAQKARTLDPVLDVPDAVRNAVRVEAINADLGFTSAKEEIAEGNYSTALKKLLVYAEVDPDNADVHMYLASVYRKSYQLDAALQHATRSLQVDRASLGAHLEMAAILLKQGDLSQGKRHFGQARLNAPEGAKLDEWFGDALLQGGFDDEGVAAFARAEARGMLSARSYWMWGVILAEREDPNAAIDRYEMALRVDPNHAHTYYSLGQVYQGLGRRDKAIENYRRAVRINPRHPALEQLRQLGVTNP